MIGLWFRAFRILNQITLCGTLFYFWMNAHNFYVGNTCFVAETEAFVNVPYTCIVFWIAV